MKMTPATEQQPTQPNKPVMSPELIPAKDPAADDLAQSFQQDSNLTKLRQNTEKLASSIAPPAPGEVLVLQKKKGQQPTETSTNETSAKPPSTSDVDNEKE